MTPPRPPLLPGERVLWEGTPPRGLKFYSQDRTLIPLSVCWTAFMIFWNVGVWSQPGGPGGWLMRLWGMPFLIVGGYFLVGRLLADAWVRARLRYFITNRRLLIARAGWGGGLRSLAITALPTLAMTERRDGSGDLRFEPPRLGVGRSGQSYEKGQWAPALSQLVQFIGIPAVATVYDLVQRTAAASADPLG